MSTNTKPLKPTRQKPRLTHRSRRARGRMGKASALLTWVAVGLVMLMGYTLQVNRSDEYGAVGVVGSLARGVHLSCGGEYKPEAPAVFHPTLPCGTKLQLTNLVNGKRTIATVTNQAVAFNPGQGRVADISVATAEALGLDAAKPVPSNLSLRVVEGSSGSLRAMLPSVAVFQPRAAKPVEPSAKDLLAFAKNMVHECGICSPYGMVGVSQVAENRLNVAYRGKTTLFGVIYDGSHTDTPQFSWTKKPRAIGKHQLAAAKKLSLAYLRGRLSGNLLAVQYVVTRDALNYFQPEIVYPSWAKNGSGLEVVPMRTDVEAMLRHRYLRHATGGLELASN